jgi:hypothetical protein
MAFQTNSLTITSILLLAPFFLGVSSSSVPQLNTTAAAMLAADCPTAAYPDCCYVTKAWLLMGKTTPGPSSQCCTFVQGGSSETSLIPGVTCTPDKKVIIIDWHSKGLKGPIASTIPYLKNLKQL